MAAVKAGAPGKRRQHTRGKSQSDKQKTEPIYLIDGSIYIFRAYFSPHIYFTSAGGEDLSALLGFADFLLGFRRRVQPVFAAVARDESLFSGFRHRLSADYKSNRALPDENLAVQLRACTELSSILGLTSYGSLEYEADDIIACLAQRSRQQQAGSPVVIVSRDKDLMQLLDDESVSLWDYPKQLHHSGEAVLANWGVKPQQIPDYLALVGDPVDSIPGVPGIGAKSAALLLAELASAEEILTSLDRVATMSFRGAARCAASLAEHAEQLLLSKKLATVVRKVATKNSRESFSSSRVKDLRVAPPQLERLGQFGRDYDLQPEDVDRLLLRTSKLLEELE